MTIDLDAFEARSLGRRLSTLHRLGAAHRAAAIAELGVASSEIALLISVTQEPGLIQDALARQLAIDRALAARGLAALEKKGLVRREEAPDDRRCKRVYPTDATQTLMEPLLTLLQGQNELLFEGFDGEERDACLSYLDRMVANLRGAMEADRH